MSESAFIPAQEISIAGIEKVDPPEIKKVEESKRFEDMLDSLITDNVITKEVTIGKNVFVLKTLSTGEYLESAYIYIASIPDIPNDVVSRVRLISNLSYAVVSINGMVIESEDKEKEQREREKLYTTLLKMPPPVIDSLSIAFGELIEEQNKLFGNIGETIENF